VNRDDLAHALRAAATVTGESQFVVVGSTAIFGSFHQRLTEERLTLSVEADLVPASDPAGAKADQLDGSLGEFSQFHRQFGFYVDGVEAATALVPQGWESRVVPFAPKGANGVIGWCLHPTDLAASKAIANRPKDHEFIRAAINGRLVGPVALADAINRLDVPEAAKAIALSQLRQYRAVGEATFTPAPDLSGLVGPLPQFDPMVFGFALAIDEPGPDT